MRSAPARRGPDSNLRSGAGPGQVRPGKVERRRPQEVARNLEWWWTETALKSRAVKDPVSLLFAPTIGAQPTFSLGRLFPLIFDHLRPSCLIGLYFFPSFLSLKTFDGYQSSIFPSPVDKHIAVTTIAGCNSSSRYRSPVARTQRGSNSTLTLLLRPTAQSESRPP